jgi:hypothetical protein
MRIEEKLAKLADYHGNIEKCIRVTMTVLADSEQKTAQRQFGTKVRKAIGTGKARKNGHAEQVKLSNGVRLKATTAAVLDMILKAGTAVPREDLKDMLIKRFNAHKVGHAVRMLTRFKYVKKTADGYIPGSNQVTLPQ